MFKHTPCLTTFNVMEGFAYSLCRVFGVGCECTLIILCALGLFAFSNDK